MDVTITSLSKEFGPVPALHDVSLSVRSGELVALLGPSGSGKTTFLRLIAGLEEPTSGQVFFGDEDASGKPVQQRNIGFVFQHYALFRHMTVAENIAFGLKVRPRSTRPAKAEIGKRVAHLLDMVQLTGLESRYPSQLSGGQRQRVALARAMAIEPSVLLLDEPFGALDAKVRKELRAWLKEFHERTRLTTFFVTHDQEEALELADRVVVMSRGRIEQVGSADDVYDRPGSSFVFSFVGESSHLPVTVEGGAARFGGRPVLAVDEGGEGRGAVFFRPQDVVLSDAPGSISGRVTAIRRLAGVRIAELDVADGGATHHVEVEIPLDVSISLGEPVRFVLPKARLFREA